MDYTVENVSPDMSFLEMLDVVNEGLIARARIRSRSTRTAARASAARAGSWSTACAHGPDPGTTVCQLHMRRFKDNDRLMLEPWRARAFPLIKDLVVDRSAFDRIIQAGGYTSVNVGGAQDANAS